MSLVAHKLTFSFAEQEVLKEISFELQAGEVLGVVGPNGAGKSTLISLLTRLLIPDQGTLLLEGVPLARLSRLALAKKIAVVSQRGNLPADFKARTMVMMGRTPHLGFLRSETPQDGAIVDAAMRRTDTLQFANRSVGALSGGERQRLLLARALAQEPRYLLLDEPTNHLDLRYQAEVLRFVRREAANGLAALVVLHDLNLAVRACDRLLVLCNGQLMALGKPAEVLKTDLVQQVYRTPVAVFPDPQGVPVVIPEV